MESLLRFDLQLFHLINQVWISSWADGLFSFIRNQYIWGPLYVFLISFLIFNYGKRGLFFCLLIILTVISSDLISSELIKKNVQRIRPCNQVTLEGQRRLIVHCGSGYSFTSTHATNHFSVAMFLVLGGATFLGRFRYLFLIWAASIAYAQVYVGVHFPFDVVAGSILGIMVGWLTYQVFHRFNFLR